MNRESEWLWIEPIIGSRRISNFCWAFILLLGAFGFFFVGLSSYLGKDLIPFLSSQQILFVPQGVVMCFYGIAGLFLSFYLWCTILWNVGSGYNKFDKKEKVVSLFRWGFPGKNRRIYINFLMKDIQGIRMEIQEGIYRFKSLYENKRSTRYSFNTFWRKINFKRNRRKSGSVSSIFTCIYRRTLNKKKKFKRIFTFFN